MGKNVRERGLVERARERARAKIRLKPLVIVIRMMCANWGYYHG